MNKNVDHPTHYQSTNGIEVIDVINAFTKDLNGVEAFDTGNIIKYICRWKRKNGIEDLRKARWYLDHLINLQTAIQSGKIQNDIDKFKVEDAQIKLNDLAIEALTERKND